MDLQIPKKTLQDLTDEVELYAMIGHDPAYDTKDDSDDEYMGATDNETHDEEGADFQPDEPGLMNAVVIPTAQNLSSDDEEPSDKQSESDDEEQADPTEGEDEEQGGEEEDEGKCNYLFI